MKGLRRHRGGDKRKEKNNNKEAAIEKWQDEGECRLI